MTVTRYVLAVLFLLMALGQTLTFGDFVTALESYRLGGVPDGPLGVLVIVTEVVAGVGLLVPERLASRRIGATASLTVAVFWSAMAVQAFARGLVIPNCGCFGRYASQPLSWFVLVQDASLLGSAIWVYVVGRGQSASLNPTPATG
ncbi:MauE/DoxX family redox-associated membrane protein [Euzebya tangerina]|uniref:MauE/DoxX family redox-associated membrane protein n=1 Tax=Euzebya tangerina TaxID=591198 RepID=UPI000E30C087|nr:MauE/DoxX family redox-associated membrane protein [Euzebya tangerina]